MPLIIEGSNTNTITMAVKAKDRIVNKPLLFDIINNNIINTEAKAIIPPQ